MRIIPQRETKTACPSGILQLPSFSDAYPDAMNYGSIGAAVRHERSHGVDDKDGER